MFPEFECPADIAAKRLLGCILERYIDGKAIRVRIVETEAYDADDPASHSYKGKTLRNSVMFEHAGALYVYFTYGMHYCCNIVVGSEDDGAAVLIRAVEPIDGLGLIRKYRPNVDEKNATNGPAKLCQALQINKVLNGHVLTDKPLLLKMTPALQDNEIVQTTRIGISKAIDMPWRFYIKDNPYVSRL